VTGEVEVTVTDPSDRDRLPGGGDDDVAGPQGLHRPATRSSSTTC
jgi:hypothetical protein